MVKGMAEEKLKWANKHSGCHKRVCKFALNENRRLNVNFRYKYNCNSTVYKQQQALNE